VSLPQNSAARVEGYLNVKEQAASRDSSPHFCTTPTWFWPSTKYPGYLPLCTKAWDVCVVKVSVIWAGMCSGCDFGN